MSDVQHRKPVESAWMLVQDELELRDLWATLIDARYLIGGITAFAVMLGAAYAFLSTPIYSSNVLLQLEKRQGGLSGIDELNAWLTGVTPAEAELQIISSRTVVSATVDELGLDVIVLPKYAPVFGRSIARQYGADEPADAWLGATSYAWGGEEIKVDRFEVPRGSEGRPLVLVAGEPGSFALRASDGRVLAQGKVGEAVSLDDGRTSLFVSVLEARVGTEFTITKFNHMQTVERLKRLLTVKERGEQTGVIEISLSGSDPVKVAEILNTIANTYVRMDVERRSAEAEQTLEFLQTQLPTIRATLDTAETRLAEHRARAGSVDLPIAAQELLSQLSSIDAEVSGLQLQQAELAQRFTANHPTMLALAEKLQRLRTTRERFDAQFRGLPAAEQDTVKLLRDAQSTKELYTLLLNKAQEIRVAKAGTIGNVRIVDPAYVPTQPVKPDKLRALILGLFVGLVAGLGAAIVRRSLDAGIHDPNLIEAMFGVPVFAIIPHAREQRSMVQVWEKTGGGTEPILAQAHPGCSAIEGFRSLRTSLQFALVDVPSNVITITGPMPSIGKSFVSTNLAHVLSETDQKVLLVDADLRKGRLDRFFGGRGAPGLSELITGSATLEQAVRKHSDNLHFIGAGSYPPNPSEVLQSKRFAEAIERVRKDYSLVIIDAAPILVVTDGVLASRVAGAVFMVFRAGVHTRSEAELALRRLQQNGITPKGAVFNDLVSRRSINYSYGDYYYSGGYGSYGPERKPGTDGEVDRGA